MKEYLIDTHAHLDMLKEFDISGVGKVIVPSGEIKTMEEFLSLSGLLKNFKAVKNGNVWCTSENMFQEYLQLGRMIGDFNAIFTDNTENINGVRYLHKLK